MSVLDRIQESFYRVTGRTEMAESISAERQMVSVLQESIAQLEADMSEPGWIRMVSEGEQEFSREGLKRITAVCRIMALKNPLVKRGLALRNSYIWGKGVDISAREPKINEEIQRFLDDNERTFSGSQAREEINRALGTDGNVFLALFTSPMNGRVRVRSIPWDEITDVITNEEDSSEPQYYRREWWSEHRDPASGGLITQRKSAYYPALGYNPRTRPAALNFSSYGDANPAKVFWDAPVYHIKVNSQLNGKWGIPDSYAAVDWALAYKDFLTDWATLVKSLSRFAWRVTSPGSKQAQVRAKLTATPSVNPLTGEYQAAGATAIQSPGQMLEAIPKSGATIDSESGRPLAAMVAAALDLPVTMLLGDPGVVGARATAETLDTPTELAMEARRAILGQAIDAILQYVIMQSVRTTGGKLTGTVVQDDFQNQVVKIRGKKDTTIDISWPDLDEVNIETVVKAIVEADSTGKIPPLVISRLLLQALGVNDIDEILDMLTGPDGEFLTPQVPIDQTGRAAMDAFQQGQDVAPLLDGGPDAYPV